MNIKKIRTVQVLFLVVFVGFVSNLYGFNLVSSVTYNGSANSNDFLLGVCFSSYTNTFYAVGYSSESVTTGNDVHIRRYDPALNLISSVTYNYSGASDDRGYDVTVDSLGNVYAVGSVNSDADIIILKYSPNLNFISSQTFNVSSQESAYGVTIDTVTGNLYIIGYVYVAAGDNDILVMKYSPDITFISSAAISGGASLEVGEDIIYDQSLGLYITGRYRISNLDFWVARLDVNTLLPIWTHAIAGDSGLTDSGYGLVIGDNNVYVTGYIDNSAGGVDILISKYDPTLTLLSSTTFAGGGLNADRGYGIDYFNNKVYLTSQFFTTNQDIRSFEIDTTLKVISSTTFNGSGNGADTGYDVAVKDSDNIFVVGKIFNGINDDMLIIKYEKPPILSISISTNTFDFGLLTISTSVVSISSIVVINDGNVVQRYKLKCTSTTPSIWAPVSGAPSADEFRLLCVFNSTSPVVNDFEPANDYLAPADTDRTSSPTVFSGPSGETGDNVPVSATRGLWLRLDTPPSSVNNQQTTTLTITAEQQP